MHYLVAYEIYRQRVAQFEREAEVRRLLPQRERQRLTRFGSLLTTSRSRAPVVARAAAEARPCH